MNLNSIKGAFGLNSNHETVDTGLCTPPNTFATEHVLPFLETDGFDELAVEMETIPHDDKDLGANPLEAARLANHNRADWAGEEPAYVDLEAIIEVSTLGGTGYLAHKYAGIPDENVDTSLDTVGVLVSADSVRAQPRLAIAQVLAYPFISRGDILLSNRVDTEGRGGVSKGVGRLVATLARADMADLTNFMWTAHYERLATAGHDRSKLDLGETVEKQAEKSAWFDPEDWQWWDGDDTDAVGDEARVVAVVPEGYEEVTLPTGESTNFITHVAPVTDIHLVVLRRLSHTWVKSLRYGGLQWLRTQLADESNSFADAWQGHVAPGEMDFDAVAALDEFLEGRSRYSDGLVEEVTDGSREGVKVEADDRDT